MPPILLSHLDDSLQTLSSKHLQKRNWLGIGAPPNFIDSFVETVCTLFDDSSLDRALKNGEAQSFLGAPLCTLLEKIGVEIDCLDHYAGEASLIEHPRMKKVRTLARQALPLLHEVMARHPEACRNEKGEYI